MHFFHILGFLVFLAFIIVAFQNMSEVDLSFVKWTFTGPLAAMLAIPFIGGVLTGMLLIFPSWWRKMKAARTNRKRVHELEKELSDFISLHGPLKQTEEAEAEKEEAGKPEEVKSESSELK